MCLKCFKVLQQMMLQRLFVDMSSNLGRLATIAGTVVKMPPVFFVWSASPTVSTRTTGIGCRHLMEVVIVIVETLRPSHSTPPAHFTCRKMEHQPHLQMFWQTFHQISVSVLE